MKPPPNNPIDRALPPLGYRVISIPQQTRSTHEFRGVSDDAGSTPRP